MQYWCLYTFGTTEKGCSVRVARVVHVLHVSRV